MSLGREMTVSYFALCQRLAEAGGGDFPDKDKLGLGEFIRTMKIEDDPAELIVLFSAHFAAAPVRVARDEAIEAIAAAKQDVFKILAEARSSADAVVNGAKVASRELAVEVGGRSEDCARRIEKAAKSAYAPMAQVCKTGSQLVMTVADIRDGITKGLGEIAPALRDEAHRSVTDGVAKGLADIEKAADNLAAGIARSIEKMDVATRNVEANSRPLITMASILGVGVAAGIAIAIVFGWTR